MPPAADETLPPVPDDIPPPGTTQPPWNQIPKFVPGVTNVQEYVQKLKFLAALWPVEYLDQLAPRAALLIEGTAFSKIARIPPSKLKVKTTDGIAALVEAIGGSWGSTELEERYEFFEKSLYGTTQRTDESHDSFLSRMEASFLELISRNTTLEEVQAYVLLRQSTLSAAMTRNVSCWSMVENSSMSQWSKPFVCWEADFSMSFRAAAAVRKPKCTMSLCPKKLGVHETGSHRESIHVERAFVSHSDEMEPELDHEFIEALVAQDDADALVVANFEGEFEEFLQETPEMYDALTSSMEARSKLVEKRRNRGFWPTKGKQKSGKGRGKGFGKRSKDREALLQRIARSHCRKCGMIGHWKAECPQNAEKSQAGSASTATAHVVFDDRLQEVYQSVSAGADEVISEAEDEYEMPSHESSPQTSLTEAMCFMLSHENKVKGIDNLSKRMQKFNKFRLGYN
jgi:hypothetical protein